MKSTTQRLARLSLSDRLARQIQLLIQEGEYQKGDRLPSIMEMARTFGVGHPTVREALKKLQTVGVVQIRHGSGVYVSRADHVLVVAAPDFTGGVTKKLLLDLVEARLIMETQSAALAAQHAAPEHLAEMRRLLDTAGANLQDDDLLNSVNMAYHREIAQASGNAVLAQLLEVLRDLFADEQRVILGMTDSRERDHEEHVQILEAMEKHDDCLASELMRQHLEGVRQIVLGWQPEEEQA
ncbi:MAG TPA: FadR/GntR family transcriptional regulator [Longimicrobiales bacterium]